MWARGLLAAGKSLAAASCVQASGHSFMQVQAELACQAREGTASEAASKPVSCRSLYVQPADNAAARQTTAVTMQATVVLRCCLC